MGFRIKAVLSVLTPAVVVTVGLLCFASSAGATEPDRTPPVVSLSGMAIKAVEEGKTTGTYELHIAATDGSEAAPQSGVAKIEVGVDGSGQQSWEKFCPEGSCALEQNWTYSPATFASEFPRWITVWVTDHAGNATEEEVSVEGLEEVPRETPPTEADTTPPTIALSGSAALAAETDATTGEYELRMLAEDGSPGAPQSGIAKIEVGVDGTMLQSWEKYCPVGSCRLKQQWTYSPAIYSGTGHVIKVVVHDHAGNVTTMILEPDKTPPTFGSPFSAAIEMRGEEPWVVFSEATDGPSASGAPGSGVASYRYRSAVNGGSYGSWAATTEPEFSASGLPRGAGVTLQVYAIDRAGNQTAVQTSSTIWIPNSPSELPPGAEMPTIEYFNGSEEETAPSGISLAPAAAGGPNAGIPARVQREIAEHLLKADCTIEQVAPHTAYSHEIWHEVDNVYFACGPQVNIVDAFLSEGLHRFNSQGRKELRDLEDWEFGALGTEIQGPFTVASVCRSTEKPPSLWWGGAGVSIRFNLPGYGEFLFPGKGETPLFADYCH